MIDLTKVPEGATHYYELIGCDVAYYKLGLDLAVFKGEIGWVDSNCSMTWLAENCKPISPWTIYNNTKPLCELSDEQASELFNYARHGGIVESFDGKRWCKVEVQWSSKAAYRAKQKSERELFIEAALDAMKLHPDDLAKRDIGKMFDAGFKAPQTK